MNDPFQAAEPGISAPGITPSAFAVPAVTADGQPLRIARDALDDALACARRDPPERAPRAVERGKQVSLPETWGVIVVRGELDPDLPCLSELRGVRPGMRRGQPAPVYVCPAHPISQRRWIDAFVEVSDDRPTYLLLVASPQAFGLDAEARLSDAFAVGRVWFDDAMVDAIWRGARSPRGCFEAWCARAIAAEPINSRPPRREIPPRVLLSGGRMRAEDRLETTLLARWRGGLRVWDAEVRDLGWATQGDLEAELAAAPDLWLHAGYGMHGGDRARRGSLKMRARADAAADADGAENIAWFGPEAARGAAGRVALLAGCYVGGTTDTVPALMAPPEARAGEKWGAIARELLALREPTHVSGLVTALLGAERGFGAVLAPYDLLFTHCLGADDDPQLSTRVHGRALDALLGGARVGEAHEHTVRCEQLLRHRLFGTGERPGQTPRAWSMAFTGWVNHRQTRLFGDPWIRARSRSRR